MKLRQVTSLIKILIFLAVLSGCINPGDNNLALYRNVFHSSSADDNHCGHLVVDGSLGTYWESLPGNDQWLTIDLGSEYDVNQIRIIWGTNFAKRYSISFQQGGNEIGSQIFSIDNNNDSISKINCHGEKARIVRVDISDMNDDKSGCVIKELMVSGKGPERFVKSGTVVLSDNQLSLNGNIWRIQNAGFVSGDPEEISSVKFNDKEWIPASVPGTIMGSYYNFGALPDPLYSDNMHQISDEFFSGNDFWYRTEIKLPMFPEQKRVFLNFRGINWKADVWFNSISLGRIEGAYKRTEFDVTGYLSKSGVNTIAVLIRHPETWKPGERKVRRKYIGAPTRNGDNHGYDSPAILASAGWNWLPIIRGRNTGIWQDVEFTIRENVSIIDPCVSTRVLLPDTTKAELTIHTELQNNSSETIKGSLVAQTGDLKLEYPVEINGNETKTVKLDKSVFQQLSIENPRLWWPNGYGRPELYRLSLEFVEDGAISDKKEITFGIRQLETRVDKNILFFYCNGQRLLLRGGNWGLPEAMMRCDSSGYDLRVRLHRDANFNMIRNWVGMTGHEAFYDACDRYGILIWDDFWLANPVDGPDPKDNEMFMDNVRDKIKWVRSHPSLALYCGRNEGYPPHKLDSSMNAETQLLDGTRLYIPHSSEGTVTGLGPYDLREPSWYFANRGITLHSELGIVAFPEFESLSRMMPRENLWPINDMWAYHDYQWGRSEKFTARIESRFGKPESAADYSRRAQLLNFETAKAMFESLQSNQGSGTLLWMSQAAWPSMICQLYDHYFEYTSAFFAVKKACRQVHVFYDVLRKEIRASNNSSLPVRNATVKAVIYDSGGNIIWHKTGTFDIDPGSALKYFNIGSSPSGKVRFLKLELIVNGEVADDNFYWLENAGGNCLDLNDLPAAKVTLNYLGTENGGYKIRIKNTSGSISLMNRIRIRDKSNGESILPVFFTDNYISLLPGEEKEILFHVQEDKLKNHAPEICLSGWNSELITTGITDF